MRDDPAAGMMRSRPRTDAELRIFCFTSAGSGASVFFSWFRGLDANFELFPYQLPGREDRRSEAAFRRMGPLVAAVVDDLTGRSEVPYALFGHSLGALIAFEVAREVRRRGLPPPVHLFASARIAPQLGLRQSPIHLLPDADFVDQLTTRYGAIPAVIRADPDLMGLFLPALRADIEVLETYAYSHEPPLDVPISVLSATGDPVTDAAGVSAWAEQSTFPIAIHSFPGDHFFPKTSTQQFIQVISNELAKSRSDGPPRERSSAEFARKC